MLIFLKTESGKNARINTEETEAFSQRKHLHKRNIFIVPLTFSDEYIRLFRRMRFVWQWWIIPFATVSAFNATLRQ